MKILNTDEHVLIWLGLLESLRHVDVKGTNEFRMNYNYTVYAIQSSLGFSPLRRDAKKLERSYSPHWALGAFEGVDDIAFNRSAYEFLETWSPINDNIAIENGARKLLFIMLDTVPPEIPSFSGITYVLVLLPGILALPVGLDIGHNDPIGHGEAGPPPWRRDAAGTQIASIFSGTGSPGHSFPLLPRAPLGQAPPWEQDGSSLNPDPPTWKQGDAEQGLSPPWIRSTSGSTIEAAPLSKQVDSTPNPDPPMWKREGTEQCPKPSLRWTRYTSGDTSEVVPLLKRDDSTLNPDPPTWKRRAAEWSTTLPEARSTCESASKVDLSRRGIRSQLQLFAGNRSILQSTQALFPGQGAWQSNVTYLGHQLGLTVMLSLRLMLHRIGSRG
ncbi:hypothetical protein F5880DRAFT_1511508 [Lentinula raphanica]|nr:hypothetical protein F5880DRAFT_1511508 [Lentinula raphanica]